MDTKETERERKSERESKLCYQKCLIEVGEDMKRKLHLKFTSLLILKRGEKWNGEKLVNELLD